MKKIGFLLLLNLFITACTPLTQPETPPLPKKEPVPQPQLSKFEQDFHAIASAFGGKAEEAIESPLQRSEQQQLFANAAAKKLIIPEILHPGAVYDELSSERTTLQEGSEANGILGAELLLKKEETVCKITQDLMIDALSEAELTQLYEQGYVEGKELTSRLQLHCADASAVNTQNLTLAREDLSLGKQLGGMKLTQYRLDEKSTTMARKGKQRLTGTIHWRKTLDEGEGLQVIFKSDQLSALLKVSNAETEFFVELFDGVLPLASFDKQTRQVLLAEEELKVAIELQAFHYDDHPDRSFVAELEIGNYTVLDE
ncbi:MAG: hypothetical protein DLD55_00465 [candidate division SR1 bacterium]|nr:MAG: hypothetical protein DLD55_00465 [candidate division SR1 bacterium]